MTSVETSTLQASEDEITKRHLKFLMFLIEAATKDPDWNSQLKQKAEMFKVLKN